MFVYIYYTPGHGSRQYSISGRTVGPEAQKKTVYTKGAAVLPPPDDAMFRAEATAAG